MTNAYKYIDLRNNVKNPTVQNTKYCDINNLEVTPIRASGILLQPSESNFEPYVPEVKTHSVTIYYPSDMTITYESTVLSKQVISDGLVKSTVIVPETQNGYEYYPVLNYSPKIRTNFSGKTAGIIELGNVTRDKTIALTYIYSFGTSGSSGIENVAFDDFEATVLPYEYSSELKKIKIRIYLYEGFQISTVTGTYCNIVSTGLENTYLVEYNGDGSQIANIQITVIEKEAETSAYSVKVSGLSKANVIYSSETLDEIDGTAVITNISDGSTILLTIESASNYKLSKILIDGVTTDCSNLTTKTISVPVNGSDVEITVETVLEKARLTIPKNAYSASVSINGDSVSLVTNKTVLVFANAKSTITFNFDSSLYKLTAVSVTSGTITKQSGTTYVLNADSTTENISLNYTLAKIEKNTVTFQNANNVTIKKGTTVLNTTSGAYSEQFTSGSSTIYTITANNGYSLNNVDIDSAKSKYSYSDGTLTISAINDDIIVTISTTKQAEQESITIKIVDSKGNVTGVTVGTASSKKEFTGTPLSASLSSSDINTFYNSAQPLSITVATGKTIKSVSSSEGGIVYGGFEDGYTFKLTSKSIVTVTITVVTSDESETPAEPTTYKVQFKGATNALIYNNDTLLSESVVGSDTIYTFENVNSGDSASFKIVLTDTDKYEFYSVPFSTGYSVSWNVTKGILTIPNITSDVVVQLYIREKTTPSDDWDGSAAFYEENSKFSSNYYWQKTSNGYEYSKTLSGTGLLAVTTAWWICVEYKEKYRYLIETSYSNVKKIYVYYTSTPKTSSSIGQAITQRVELDSTKFSKSSKGYVIPAKYITQSSNYKYIYFAFYRESASTEKFLITDVKYVADDDYITTAGAEDPAFGTTGVYNSNTISDFQYIAECDPTAQNNPYSSLSFSVYDRDNDFILTSLNQAKTGNITNDKLIKGTPYNIYTLSAEVPSNRDLADYDYYAVQIGRMYLNNITHDNDYANFEFIGTIEKYDNIYLTSEEKRMSSYWEKINVRNYLQELFGSDIDETGIPEHFTALTPFEDESKSEILRIICDYCNMTMFEGANGKIRFSTDTLINKPVTFENMTSPYRISLNNCFNFPIFGQASDYCDSVDVQISKRIKSDTEKLFNNVDFTLLVKTVVPIDSENWQEDSDWQVVAKTSGGTTRYYDMSGQEYIVSSDSGNSDTVDALKILDTYGELKYIKFEIDFKEPSTDIQFYSSSLLDDTNPVKGLKSADFRKYMCGSTTSFFFDWTGESLANGVDVYISEKKIELFAKFPISLNPNYGVSSQDKYTINYGYIDVYKKNAINKSTPSEAISQYSGANVPATINYSEIVFDLFFSIWFTISESVARPIKTITRNYSYKPYQTVNSTFQNNNALISSISDAIWCSSIGFQKINNASAEANIEDWKGNGLIELADDILIEHSTGREYNRTYNKFYCGKVKKIVYNFNGALSMDTTLSMPPTVYYESENAGDVVNIFPSQNTTFANDKVEFTKKTT